MTRPEHPSPNLNKMAEAVRLFLEAAGMDMNSADLLETPSRVAQAWAVDLIDGYQQRIEDVMGEPIEATSDQPIFALGVRFVSMCPHHLLPYEGVAHVAYLPGARLIGLSRLSKLVDAFAHRLVLQENLCAQVPLALMQHLGAVGAGCVMVARHGCMAQRGVRQDSARIVTTAWQGAFHERPDLQRVLLAEVQPPR